MENKKRNSVATVLLTIVCILWMYPIVLILINSLKKEVAITTSGVFSLPTSETWNGVANFVASVTQMDFFLVQSCNFCNVCSSYHVMLFNGSLVYCSCKWKTVQDVLLSLRVQYGSSFPDGYVYTGKNSRYLTSE